MPRKFAIVLGLCAMAALAVPGGASAASLPVEAAKSAAETSAVDKAHYREHRHWRHRHHDHRWHHRHYRRDYFYGGGGGYGRCRAWRHECAERWGWGGHGFRRCLWRHGC